MSYFFGKPVNENKRKYQIYFNGDIGSRKFYVEKLDGTKTWFYNEGNAHTFAYFFGGTVHNRYKIISKRYNPIYTMKGVVNAKNANRSAYRNA